MSTELALSKKELLVRRKRKLRVGVVTSNRMQKTIVVRVEHLVRHAKYSRVIKQVSSFKAHDEKNSAGIGDLVKIMETRPLSKYKRWRLVEIVKRASSAPPVPGAESEETVAFKESGSDAISKSADELQKVAEETHEDMARRKRPMDSSGGVMG